MPNETNAGQPTESGQPTPPTQETVPVTPPPAYAPAQPAAPADIDTSPRSYLAIVVLALFAGQLGLARWYRGDQSGKTRFWIAVACMGISWIPFINILSALGLFGLSIWGLVDFFLLHKTTADANNTPYVASQRDITWAKNLKTYYIVLICIVLALFVIGIIVGLTGVFYGTSGSSTTIRNYY